MYSKTVIYGKIRGLTAVGCSASRNPPAAKFTSQGEAHMRTNAQFKRLVSNDFLIIVTK